MKKFIFMLVICVAFMGCKAIEAEASSRRHRRTAVVQPEVKDVHNVIGVKVDAPNLVKIDKEGQWTLGVEGGKELVKDVFYENEYVEADKGYFAFLKVTYNGCLLNCKQGE